jgi:adenosine deaminase
MDLNTYITAMPKIELHVHLEGSIRPETLLILAQRSNVTLPAQDVEGLRRWYTFRDFAHFIEIYMTFARCLRTPDDIELIAREFFSGQAAQNIRYSEVTYTPYSQYVANKIPFHEQLAALNRARDWAEQELGVSAGWVFDISRNTEPEEGLVVAEWAISAMGDGCVALGLGGPEIGNPPEKFREAFERAHNAGLPAVPHAGETEGPASIWGALEALHAVRIGHGVRCLEDPALVQVLRERQIPLEVCPTSNVCLKVTPEFASHPFRRLVEDGLVVTLNSDDPPMFNTTLTDEYRKTAATFQLSAVDLENLVLTALHVSLLPEGTKQELENEFQIEYKKLKA